MKAIGMGMSRIAYLMEDNRVMKIPSNERGVGACASIGVFNYLLEQFSEDKSIAKIITMRRLGYTLSNAAKEIVTEYLISKLIENSNFEYKDNFAYCVELKVRKARGKDKINVRGFYENAYTKLESCDLEEIFDEDEWSDYTIIMGDYEIRDLHPDNIIDGKVIVDYAAIQEW